MHDNEPNAYSALKMAKHCFDLAVLVNLRIDTSGGGLDFGALFH